MKLTRRPIRLREARRYIGAHHTHSLPPKAWLFGVAVEDDARNLVGVGVAGRPTGRGLDDGRTVEILRVCTQGAPNACSRIYGSLAKAAAALGYTAAYTYTLASECGTCPRAAGFTPDAELAERGGWDTPARPRVERDLFGVDRTPPGAKVRWVRRLAS